MNVSVRTRVLIADDHPLILVGIRRSLERDDDLEIIGEATSAGQALALTERRLPEIVLLDLQMPDVSGTDVITQIRHRWPEMKVVVLSESDDRTTMDRVMAAGASAYLLKTVNPVDLPSVIRQVAAGAIFLAPARAVVRESDPVREALTERERTILAAISSGRTTSAISRELWVSEHTIKFHLTNIYRKLGVSNRAGAIRFAMEHGLAA